MPRNRLEGTRGAGVFALAVLTCLCACKEERKPDPGNTPPAETARKELLSAVAACEQSQVKTFQSAAVNLERATAGLAATPGVVILAEAQSAYNHAMGQWQVLEAMQVGPALPRSQPGGAELRDNIYSWPLVSRCAVEEQIVARGYESPDFPATLVSRRGLYALEFLLYYEGTDTACPPSSPIVSGGTWAALPASELQARKRAYAAAVAKAVRERADQLVDAWEPGKGNFVGTLTSPGADNAVYPSVQMALNSVSDAVFYLDKEMKDRKLARPLGLLECEAESCPELLESIYARRSKANLLANLIGIRNILEGCGQGFSGKGFDDLLEEVGSGPLAATLRTRLAAADDALGAINEVSLADALVEDKASVRAFYDSLKGVTDLLKTDFVTVLDLELPQSVEGDND